MGTSSRILTLSLSSTSTIRFSNSFITIPKLYPFRRVIYQGFIPLSTITEQPSLESSKHSILLERLRIKHLKDSVGGNNNANKTKKSLPLVAETADKGFKSLEKKNEKDLGFSELGLSEEVLGALGEMGIAVPTEIQRLGIPAVLDEKSVVLGSHTGSGKTLAYLLPLVQCPRQPGITECGFYDMKFMKEIVHGGVEILGNVGGGAEYYADEDMMSFVTNGQSYAATFIIK